MKKVLFVLLGIICQLCIFSQEKMYVHLNGTEKLTFDFSTIDSIYFDGTLGKAYFVVTGTVNEYSIANIDSITFIDYTNTISIQYNGNVATVLNPLADQGVSVVANGANVVVNSTTETRDICYVLSGNTTNGSFKAYSEKRFNLFLNGVELTNKNGPAINIQSGIKAFVHLVNGTSNKLTDGTTYADAPTTSEGKLEDQDATFFSEGKLEFSGDGSLVLKSVNTLKHALASDETIEIHSGTIKIEGAGKDGIHSDDAVVINGGLVDVTSTSDAIDGGSGYIEINGGTITTQNSSADVKALTCDSMLTINGGTLNLTITGNQSKAISSKQNMFLNGGNININTTGATVLNASGSGFDPSYCTAIKSSASITINGATVTVNSSGTGSKGISANENIEMFSGSVNITCTGDGATYTNSSDSIDSYNATCLTADGNVFIEGGSLTLTSTGTAGKGITVDGELKIGEGASSPVISVITSGSKITVSETTSGGGNTGGPGGGGNPGGGGQDANNGKYNEAKTIKAKGAIVINNGDLTLSSADDGIKSNTSVTINGGNLLLTKSVEGIESLEITINGGNVNLSASDDCINTSKGGATMKGSDGSKLNINGGYITVNSTVGDAIDSNGDITMTGGTVIDHGPTSDPEEGVDFNGTFKMTGGFFVASGSNSGMNQPMSTTSTQNNIYILSSSKITEGSFFNIQDNNGLNILTFKPVRAYYSIVFTSSELKTGVTYSIYTGGSYSGGTEKDGLYTNGTYTKGTLKKSFSLATSGTVTSVKF
jgi:trimeric autotransporter adhesin